jgi:signal transduction histidine kinase
VVGGAVAPLIINQASKNPEFANHPGVKLYGIESYIAVPLIRRDGNYFGTLCSLDPRPANLNENSLTIFKLLSQLIAFELEAEDEKQAREAEISALNDVISIAAHDLRQPLTTLQLRAFLAARWGRRDGVSPELETMLDSLVTDVRRAAALTDILLDVGRIEAGGFKLDISECDLVQIILKAVEDLESTILWANFKLELPPELKIQVDETRLGQVIRNLLDNAIKYSPGSTRPVEISLSRLPGEINLLQVRDYGMGVQESDLPRLFERQFRTQEAKASNIQGSGFGLYISQKFIEAHQGQIWADLPSGGGLRFNITLPNDVERRTEGTRL